MFLCPQMRHEFSSNQQSHRAIDDDPNDHDNMHHDAYDSAYVKYYND
jgi:hypothetical protein